MKFNFSSGVTLAFGKCEPALKLNFLLRVAYSYDSLEQLIFPVRKPL